MQQPSSSPVPARLMAQFRRLDLFRKFNDAAEDVGVVRHSKTGVYLSLATIVTLVYLFVGQTVDYLTPRTRTSYRVAKHQPETLGIFFGVNFSSVPCSAISVDYANLYGSFALNSSANVTAREYLQATAQQHSGVTAANAIKMTKIPYFNAMHDKDVSSNFVGGFDSDYVPDESWGCDSGKITDPDALVPCINRDVLTTVLFVAKTSEPSMQFAKQYSEYAEAVAAGAPHPPPATDTSDNVTTTTLPASATTLNHRAAVERSTLVVDCTQPHLKVLCTQHGVFAVPTAFTYRAGNRVSSMLVRTPAEDLPGVYDHFGEDLVASPNARCLAWRQTGQCNPLGPREPWRDLKCSAVVDEGSSGYCECVGHAKANLVSCAHGTGAGGFTCEEVCLDATAGGRDGNLVDLTAQKAHSDELERRQKELQDSVSAQEKERARLETQISALKRRHEELVSADAAAEEELEALKKKAAALHSALEEADKLDAEAANDEQAAETAVLAGNVSATVLRQQLAVVREQVQSGAQHQTRVHADLADALSEAARLKSDLAALTGAAGRENANSSTELLKDEIQLGDADNALTSLHAQLLAVQSELKASLRQQAQERALSSDVEGETLVEVLMHRAHEAEMREQAAHAGPLLAPLDVSAAIREFVGSGCYISGVGSIDNVPGSLIFSVELPHALAFPAALVDWSHKFSHVIFTHADSAVPRNEFDPALQNLHVDESLEMNALGGKKFASTMAFTSYDHFLDLLETHVVLGDSIDQKILPSEEEGVGFRVRFCLRW
eukprot:INCI9867.1.p1 GENE.INCI9867.1~~INCI9867.1.p1  ORF type:complete len:781 (-),score=165.44 INCI9867.1:330-2672(-)